MPDPTVNNVWGQTSPANAVQPLELPSGQIVKARRIGIEMLVQAGIVGEADELTKMVSDNHFSKKNVSKVAGSMMRDPKAFGALMEVIDRAAPLIVVEPTVRLHLKDLDKPAPDGSRTVQIPAEEREDGIIYTDQIPFTDKVELMNFGVGGLTDLARFREQPTDSVAAVVDGEDVPDATQPVAVNRRDRRRKKQSSSVRNR